MTFDAAFDRAAALATAVTVEASPRNWLQRLRLEARDRWKPTPSERIKAVEGARNYVGGVWMVEKKLPEAGVVRDLLEVKYGFGPLTMLWVAVMVAQLLAALKHLLESQSGE